MVGEVEGGGAEFERMRQAGRDSLLERVGKDLRGMMPFIDTPAEDH